MISLKPSVAAIADILSGYIPTATLTLPTVISYAKSGKLRALGVTGSKRWAPEPDIPTIDEAGVPGYEAIQWYGVLAPAGTPREIVLKVNAAVNKTLSDPAVRDLLLKNGAEPVGSTPEEFAAFIRLELDKWAKVIREAGIDAK